LLVLGDGAAWIRTWFESLGISPKAMILCWWHPTSITDGASRGIDMLSQ
jgi:hypothetical protein